MARSLLVALALSSSLLADAAPKARAPLSDAERAASKKLLAKARAQQGKKDYAGAIKTLEELLAHDPDDAVALGELGFTAYLAKDLKKAEEYTRRSIAAQATPSVRGATLFNLGMILEDRGDKPGAIASYLESLRSRPNATVLAKLRKLDAVAADSLDPYRPVPLASYASIAAFCKTQPAKYPVEYDAGLEYSCDCGDKQKLGATKLAAPYEAVDVFTRVCSAQTDRMHDPFGTWEDFAVVKVGGAWYVDRMGSHEFNRACDSAKTYTSATSTGTRLLVAYHEEGSCGRGLMTEWTTDRVVAFGIGASKAVSAMPALEVVKHEGGMKDSDTPPDRVDVALDLAWGTGDTLEVKAPKSKGLDPAAAKLLVGKHALAFP